QVQIAPGSTLVGVTLSSSRLRLDLGLIIVAIKKKHGAMVYTPPPEAVLEAGDTLIALGKKSQLEQVERLAPGKGGGEEPEGPDAQAPTVQHPAREGNAKPQASYLRASKASRCGSLPSFHAARIHLRFRVPSPRRSLPLRR